MTREQLNAEMHALIDHFEDRGIGSIEACATMALTLSSLLTHAGNEQEVIETLRAAIDNALASPARLQ